MLQKSSHGFHITEMYAVPSTRDVCILKMTRERVYRYIYNGSTHDMYPELFTK